MPCQEHKEYAASNTWIVSIRTQGMSCLKHTEYLDWNTGNALCGIQEDWEKLERENKSHYGYQILQPYCLWAEAHTLSVQDEVITITRDANNNVSHFQYGKDNFNTICVKNLDEARKLENNNALFGGLYVVDYSTKKIYRLTVKQNDRVRLERIMNSYVTGLPWFRSKKFNKVRIWNGVLDTLQYRPSENGY